MDDLRERLERLSARAEDEANAIDRLHAARSRGLRRRRIGTTVLALVVAVAGTTLAFNSLHGGDAQIAAGDPSPSGPLANWQPPEVPFLWPENWSRDGFEQVQRVQEAADAGDANATWRLDPNQVIDQFAKGVLGWASVDVHSQVSGPGFEEWGISQACSECPPPPDVYERVRLVQPVRGGQSGIWSVAAVQADGLGVTANPKDDPIDAFMPGSALPVKLNVPGDQTVVVGAVGQNGCADFASVDQDVSASYELPLPNALQPGENGYDCGTLAASYLFAYTVPKLTVPTGDPFLEPAAITAMTAVPYLQAWVLGDVAPATESEAPPTDVAAITCGGSTMTVLTPTVAAQPDGVHIAIHNTSSDPLSVQFENFGDGAQPNSTTELIEPLPPGTQKVRCEPQSDNVVVFGWETFKVVDPSAYWVPDVLDCPGPVFSLVGIDYATTPEGVGDPIEAVRSAGGIVTLEPGDDLQVVGYPDAPDSREVIVTRQGTPVDLVQLSRGSQGWYVSGGDHCSA
jgi:hypothetical protein